MGKLLICDPVDAAAIDEMRTAGITVDVHDDITPAALAEIIGGYDGIVVRSRTKVGADLIDRGTALKVIIRGGAGLDTIDVVHARTKGISVQNTPAANSNAVVELALGMMLSLARHIDRADTGMKAGKWEKKTLEGTEIEGKTLGVVGYGRIGRMLGEKAKALGMTVLAFDPFVEHPDIVPLDTLLAHADYISVHVPLNKETANLLDADAFAKMKDGVFLVQASRGGTVNEAALYEALVSGKVAGAGIDVFSEEPPKSEALQQLVALPQVIATPHIGAATEEALARVGGEIVKLAKAALA